MRQEEVEWLELRNAYIIVAADGFVLVLFELRAQKLLGCVVGDDLRHVGTDVWFVGKN